MWYTFVMSRARKTGVSVPVAFEICMRVVTG
jgi:hypothetical protein